MHDEPSRIEQPPFTTHSCGVCNMPKSPHQMLFSDGKQHLFLSSKRLTQQEARTL